MSIGVVLRLALLLDVAAEPLGPAEAGARALAVGVCGIQGSCTNCSIVSDPEALERSKRVYCMEQAGDFPHRSAQFTSHRD